MNTQKQKVLLAFTKEKNKPLSTSDLVKHVFKKEYEECQDKITTPTKDKEVIKLGKRELARLHRKLLYHLNTLVQDSTLIVTNVKGKGEKHYAVNTQKEQDDYKLKKIVETITGRELENVDLQGLEKFISKGYIKKPKSNYIRKLKTILINPKGKTLTELFILLEDLMVTITDTIAIEDFQTLISQNEPEHLQTFLRKLDYESQEYNIQINLLLEAKSTDQARMTDFLESLKKTNLKAILLTSVEEIGNKNRLFKKLLGITNVSFQNKAINHSPIILGKEGAYSVSRKHWDEYLQVKNDLTGLLYSSTSVVVDAKKVFERKLTYFEFRELIIELAKNMIKAMTHQRRNADTLFFKINHLNKAKQKEFYQANTSYIRLKHIESEVKNSDDELLNLLESTTEQLKEFCTSSETIFKSCGLPTRIRIKLGTTTPTSTKDVVTNEIIKTIDSHHSFANIKDTNQLITIFNECKTALIEVKRTESVTLEKFI